MGNRIHSLLRNRAFLIGILGGFFGVLPDIDHIPQYITGLQYPALIPSWPSLEYRPLHFTFLLIACAGIACSGGYLSVMVLKQQINK
jgi:hypothetical protein